MFLSFIDEFIIIIIIIIIIIMISDGNCLTLSQDQRLSGRRHDQ
jgi:hypothetical protein